MRAPFAFLLLDVLADRQAFDDIPAQRGRFAIGPVRDQTPAP
jgi:hypothetical protein